MLILASSSPRRQELLKKIVSDFIIVNPNVDERNASIFSVSNYALELSKLKAYDVFSKHTDDTVLAVDTIVVFNNKIINKPKDREDAKNILRKLSGKKHLVISGYTLINSYSEVNRNVKTIVKFNELSEELINEYVDKGFADGKAGAYGIQDNFPLVSSIEGSYYNVMGLPIEDIKKYIVS